jgi:K+-transporting ATPase ATPase B chain
VQWRNPVMFVVYVGSILTTALGAGDQGGRVKPPKAGFILAIALWLWFTVLFANFAEALAEGRSKAQAASLRGLKKETWAKKLRNRVPRRRHGIRSPQRKPAQGRRGAGRGRRHHPGRRRGHRRRRLGRRERHHRRIGAGHPRVGRRLLGVTGGTRVLSDWLVVRITVNPGETFLDRMIAMVEGAKRQKTPNEIALTILLVALTIVFLASR